MKRIILIAIALVLLPFILKAQTKADMTAEFRDRIAETDTLTSLVTDTMIGTFLNHAQDKQVRMANYLPAFQDIIYSRDSSSYRLDAAFKYETGVILRTAELWEAVLLNVNFQSDIDRFSYQIKFHTTDTAHLYIQGRDIYAGDTIRVFYNGTATRLTLDTTTCDVSRDLQVRIIEEAIIMYEEAKRSWTSQQLLWQQLRIDMGVVSPQQGEKQ